MNKNKKRILIGGISMVLIIGIVCGMFAFYKIYRTQKAQEKQITQLLGQIDYLDERLTQSIEYYDFETEYREDTFNYFAIGNSLTLIKSWGRGICSTQPDNDYFNLVKKALENKYGEVVAYPYNFSSWERMSNREKAYSLIDSYLSEDLDLVTIQLGENVTDLSTYEVDLEKLVAHIKETSPKATIVIIGDWWSEDKTNLRRTAANNTGVIFADLSDVIGDSSYQSEVGLECYKSDGSTITVTKAAAAHPGDKGMEYIAEKIIEALGIK